jgi:hypothetical protein
MFARFASAALAGLVLAALGQPARAGHGCGGTPDCAPACAAPAAPAFRTITVTEWVPEQYQATRTVYKTVCAEEKYTAYRTECVKETRTRKVPCTRIVPEECVRTCTEYQSVPSFEEHTVYKTVVSCVPVTTVVRKCIDKGHYECREVPCAPSFCQRLKHRCHGHDCCEPCCPPPTKVVKVWVPCPVWVETPVTVNKTVCTQVPQVVRVCVNKVVPVQKTYKVCINRCVTEWKEECYEVEVPRCVPYEAVRTVTRCVPCQEVVTLCRLVPRCVTKQVPVENCCYAVSSCCGNGVGHRLFGCGGCCH